MRQSPAGLPARFRGSDRVLYSRNLACQPGGSVPSELAVIIDDSATSRTILERLTASLGGIATHSFADAEGALSFCRERRPGLVIVGEPAGEARAADFVRSLRAVTGGAEIPVLVISP